MRYVTIPNICLNDLTNARRAFEENEPRNLFYRAATDLVARSLDGASDLTVSEALAILLLTWNKAYYQYKKTCFAEEHFSDIDRVIQEHLPTLIILRRCSIESIQDDDQDRVMTVFRAFDFVLGSVGAAKALHLLAPKFFPLWDRTIAYEYGYSLGPSGSNAQRYWRFMQTTKEQILSFGGAAIGTNPLKSLDEYNYCHFSKKWI